MTSFNTFHVQDFSISKPIMNYLMDTVSGKALQKLHKTCKYFYAKKHFTILDFLYTGNFVISKRKIIKYCVAIHPEDLNLLPNNLWLARELFLTNDILPSRIISKVVKCDIYLLNIGCSLTLEEFKFLTNSGNIKDIHIGKNIYCLNDEPVPLENIFPLIPKTSSISIYNFKLTQFTMDTLLTLNHQVKIERLIWHRINREINAELIYLFLEKILAFNAYVSICFENQNFNDIFAVDICQMMNLWEPAERKPQNFPYIYLPRWP